MEQATAAVTGTARVKLFKGNCGIAGRTAQASLYDHGLATYEEGDSFQHGAAAGFIHVWSLGTKTWSAATQQQTDTVRGGTNTCGLAASAAASIPPSSISRRRSRSTAGCCPTTCGRAPCTCTCWPARA